MVKIATAAHGVNGTPRQNKQILAGSSVTAFGVFRHDLLTDVADNQRDAVGLRDRETEFLPREDGVIRRLAVDWGTRYCVAFVWVDSSFCPTSPLDIPPYPSWHHPGTTSGGADTGACNPLLTRDEALREVARLNRMPRDGMWAVALQLSAVPVEGDTDVQICGGVGRLNLTLAYVCQLVKPTKSEFNLIPSQVEKH